MSMVDTTAPPQRNRARLSATLKSLYATKLTLLAIVTLIVGITMFALSFSSGTSSATIEQAPVVDEGIPAIQVVTVGVAWKGLALQGLGIGLIQGALITFVFEFLLRKESDSFTETTIADALEAERGNLVASLSAAMLPTTEQVRTLGSADRSALLEELLTLDFQSPEIAAQVKSNLELQAANTTRWSDLQVDCQIRNPSDEVEKEIASQYLQAFFRFRYRTELREPQLKFRLEHDRSGHETRLSDEAWDVSWYAPRVEGEANPSRPLAFHVTTAQINGRDLAIRRNQNSTWATDTWVEPLVGTQVQIDYQFRVLVRKYGNSLQLEIPYPCLSASYSVNFSASDIIGMRALDFFSGPSRAAIAYVPNERAPEAISVSVPGWIVPRSGVVFVWSVDEPPPASANDVEVTGTTVV